MIRVVEWGTGQMGQGMLRYVLDRPRDLELVGCIVTSPAKVGTTVGGLIGCECDVVMTDDFESVLAKKPDVVLINTQSDLHRISGQVEPALRAGCNVLCIAETLAYPWASDPAWADSIAALAEERGVSILGTGINPGFMMDALAIAWSSVCLKVDRIEVKRVNDLSPYGPTVLTSQGVGTTPEDFGIGVANGSIVGHIGFPESIGLIAKAVGWEIDSIEETREPILTSVERSTPHVIVKPGDVAGCRHVAKAYSGGDLRIELVHPQQIHPGAEGQETGDYINIIGTPEVHMQNVPEHPGGMGTVASTGNYIPLIVEARPGMLTVLDMPLPRFFAPTANP
jgi:hypothetical protein